MSAKAIPGGLGGFFRANILHPEMPTIHEESLASLRLYLTSPIGERGLIYHV